MAAEVNGGPAAVCNPLPTVHLDGEAPKKPNGLPPAHAGDRRLTVAMKGVCRAARIERREAGEPVILGLA